MSKFKPRFDSRMKRERLAKAAAKAKKHALAAAFKKAPLTRCYAL